MSTSPSVASTDAAFSPWPYAIIAVFVALACGGVALYMIANADPSEWLNGNAYEDGMRYQQVIEQEQLFYKNGWTAQFSKEGGKELAILLAGPGETPLHGRTVHVYAMRPGDSRLDRKVPLEEISPGTYRAKGVVLEPGLWVLDLTVNASDDGGTKARTRQRVVID